MDFLLAGTLSSLIYGVSMPGDCPASLHLLLFVCGKHSTPSRTPFRQATKTVCRNTVWNHSGIVLGFTVESRSPSTGFPHGPVLIKNLLRWSKISMLDTYGHVMTLSGHPKTGQWWSGQNRPTGRGRGQSCFILQAPVEASQFSCANSLDHISVHDHDGVDDRAWR
jgi:hypothetical protein